MKRIETGDENTLSYREPFYWSWILAVPFYLVATCFVLGFGLMMLKGVGGKVNGVGLLIILGVGLFVFYLGLTTAWDWFGRRGCTVDREQRTLTVKAGLFLTVPYRTVSLADFNRLHIHGWREVGSRTGMVYRTEYYIDLYGPNEDYVRLGRAESKDDVLAMADELGEFADLDVIDNTWNPPDVRRRANQRLFDSVLAALAKVSSRSRD